VAKIPIPDDWNGQAWTNVCIAWPNSTLYIGLLNGLLTYLTRGRIYDETTGDIKAAQAIGWEIWRRNQPFRPCGDSVEAPKTPGLGMLPCIDGDLFEEDCEENMSANGPCPPLKIEGGKLYWWQCCEWLEVGAIGGAASQEEIPEDSWEEGGQTPTYYACGKAYAVWTVINRTAEAIWEASEDVPLYNVIGYVEAAAGFNLSNNAIIRGIADVQLAKIGGISKAELLDPVKLQEILCHLVQLWQNDNIGVPDVAFKDSIFAVYRSETTWLESAVWQEAIEALGKGTLNNVAVLNATDNTQDCDCVGETLSPVRFGDVYATNVPAEDTVTLVKDLYGKRVTVTWDHNTSEAGKREFSLHLPLIVPGAGTQIKILVEKVTGSPPTNDWTDAPCPDSDPTLWTRQTVLGPGAGDWVNVVTDEDGAEMVESTYSPAEVPTEAYNSSIRFCPRTETGDRVWRYTIKEWNDTPV
jgi:hypothetical protein